MKKHTIFLAILVFSLTLFAQDIQEEAVAINIEVPTRVFKGKTFIDNLTIDDFEIYEDGVLQTVEAVYLIKKVTRIGKVGKKDSRIFLGDAILFSGNAKTPPAFF